MKSTLIAAANTLHRQREDFQHHGITYKVLRREKVTAFYDADGNTIFDVENKRLEKEYGYLMKETAVNESAEPAEAASDEGSVKETPEDAVAEKAAEVPAGDVKAKAISKLDSEFLSLKKESDKKFAKPCIDYLKKRCEEDLAICEDILQEHKTWQKCYDYVYGQKQILGHFCLTVIISRRI